MGILPRGRFRRRSTETILLPDLVVSADGNSGDTPSLHPALRPHADARHPVPSDDGACFRMWAVALTGDRLEGRSRRMCFECRRVIGLPTSSFVEPAPKPASRGALRPIIMVLPRTRLACSTGYESFRVPFIILRYRSIARDAWGPSGSACFLVPADDRS